MNKKQAYFILITTFILILVWIVFSIIQSRVNSTISEPLTLQIAPINPTFDTETITALKKRIRISPAAETSVATNAASPSQQITPTPSLTQQESTVSAIPNNTP